MKRSPADRADLHVSAQVAAALARLDATSRAGALQEQDRVFLDAMRELQAVRDFVGSPENILGRAATKHGEVAERVHVGVSRAWDVLHRRAPIATTDGVPRTGPVDYRVDGVDIQSKYYNGLRNTLDGVASHAEKYPGFPDGPGRYHIPRDQHRQLDEFLRTGGIEGQSDRSASALQRRLDDLERTTGRPADDLIEPGDASYAEVQRGRVHDTLRNREDRLTHENEELERTARVEHGPSTAGFVKAASLGVAVGGGVGLAQAIWIKCREGRNPFRGEFSIHDWQDVGVVAAQGAGGGAVAGSSLYLLTNSTSARGAVRRLSRQRPDGHRSASAGPLRRNDRRRAVCGDVAHHRHGRRGRGVGVRGRPDHDPRSAAWRPARRSRRETRHVRSQGRSERIRVGFAFTPTTSTSGTPSGSSTRSSAPSRNDWTLGSATWNAWL